MTNSSFVNLIYYLSEENRDELKMAIKVKSIKDSGNIHQQNSFITYSIDHENLSEDDKMKKIIFIEKPFVPKNLSKREKNEKFFKRSLMASLVKGSVNNRNRNDAKKHVPDLDNLNSSIQSANETNEITSVREKKDDSFNVDHSHVTDFESFGVIENKSIEKKGEITKPSEEKPIAQLVDSSMTTQKRLFEADASEINSFKKIKLIETSEQEIKVLEEVKKPVQANESAAESLVMDTSDYEDYGDDEDEKNNLVIEVDNGSEYDVDETPASPVELTPQADLPKPKEILMQTEPIEQS